MNPAILDLHAMSQADKHCQSHFSVRGVSSVGKEGIFEIPVDTGAQVSLVCKALLNARSLHLSAMLVNRGVAHHEIIEGCFKVAEISLQFVYCEQTWGPALGDRHQIKGLLYEADMAEWDTIMSFDFLHIAHAGVPPHRRTLLVKEADNLTRLSTSMQPQAVRSVLTRPPIADFEDHSGLAKGAFCMALGQVGLDTDQVYVIGSAALRKCPRVWTNERNGWKRGWSSDIWDLLYIHARHG